MKTVLNLLLLFVVTISCFSCSKEEGEGGNSSINGKLFIKNYNNEFTNIKEEYYAQGEDVYIIYGDDEIFSDKCETHHDGTFIFKYLRKGNYTIFAYSKDTTVSWDSTSIKTIVQKNIEITKNGQDIVLDDLIIID